jgi:hypothetical protein
MKDLLETISLIVLILFIVLMCKWCDNSSVGIYGNARSMWIGDKQ